MTYESVLLNRKLLVCRDPRLRTAISEFGK